MPHQMPYRSYFLSSSYFLLPFCVCCFPCF
nr:MAG TPA: putative membrane protein [Bacteriophage sp.]